MLNVIMTVTSSSPSMACHEFCGECYGPTGMDLLPNCHRLPRLAENAYWLAKQPQVILSWVMCLFARVNPWRIRGLIGVPVRVKS